MSYPELGRLALNLADLEWLGGRLWLSSADIPRPPGPAGGGGRELLTPAPVCPPAMSCSRRRLARPNDMRASAGVACRPVRFPAGGAFVGEASAYSGLCAAARRPGWPVSRWQKKNVIPITLSFALHRLQLCVVTSRNISGQIKFLFHEANLRSRSRTHPG